MSAMKTEGIEPYSDRPVSTLRDISAIFFRQRWAMLIAFAVVVIAATASGVWIPTYEAHMKILVQRQRSDAIVTSSANAPVQFSGEQVSEEDINSEVELLNSEDLLRGVVLSTQLSGQHNSRPDRGEEVRIANAVRRLSKDLKIEALRKTHVISVQYQSRDPKVATEVLKVLASAYTEKHTEVHRPSGEFKFFDQQTEQFQQGLGDAQKKLVDFTKKSGVVSWQIERDTALQRASEFETNARQAKTTIAETEQRIRSLQEQLQSVQPRMTTVVRASDNPQLLQQLKSILLSLQLKRTELLTKYAPDYRLVQEADKQIADAKSAISAEESKPIREETTDQNPTYQWIRAELTKAEADLSGLRARAASAASAAEQYRESARNLDQDGVVQQDLLRDAKAQEDSYLLYLHKRQEAGISDALDQRGILNVAMAEQPVVPAIPTHSPVSAAIVTFLLAITGSFSTAFVADFVDPHFRTPAELAGYLGMPVLAALPKGSR
jgi:protein tyrosine kinase modulator